MFLFDSVTPLERIKLTGQLSKKVPELVSAKTDKQPLKVVRLSAEIAAILATLGATVAAGIPAAQGNTNPVETARYYPQEQRRTKGQRQKDNDRAVALLEKLKAEGRAATEEEKSVLARFSGYGGGLVDPEGKEGSPYEYYTPPPVASGVWEIIKGMGFTGGKVLDPCSGSGVFAATRPESAVIDQVELSALSGGVNALVNDGDTCKTTISPFEAVAAVTPDNSYDVVITNVPFGDANLREFAKQDPKYQNETLEGYFILRSLDKLKHGGLAAFITPPRCVSGSDAKSKDLRFKASLKAEFMGAYRLPNKIFQDASDADTIVDVIVFRKHSADATAKIEELAQQDTSKLGEAMVLWDEFLKGKYFTGEGKRYVLGEFQRKDSSKFRDVDRVISEQSTANIAKLMTKFPGSRINWELLDAAEVAPIVYRNGDTIYQDGRTLEYQDGKWIPRESTASEDADMQAAHANCDTPLTAVNTGVTLDTAMRYVEYMRNRARALDIPDWIVAVTDSLKRVPEGERADWFLAVTAGLAVTEVIRANAPSEPFNYGQAYPKLTERMMEVVRFANKSNSALTRAQRDGLTNIGIMYSKRNGFSARWTGTGRADVEIGKLSPTQAYEKLKYEASDDYGFIDIDRLAAVMGQEFDPFLSDDWCVSPDGKRAIKASDYFTGRYADVLAGLQEDLQAAGDPKVRDKILRQRVVADSRVMKPAPERITFNMFSPYVSMAKKVEFLRENVDPRFNIEIDDEGKPSIAIDISSSKNERERMLRRYVEHLKIGTLTTRTSQEEAMANPELEAKRLAELRELVSSTNARFNVWVKSNGEAFDEVKRNLLAPENLYFREEEDTSRIDITGVHPDFKPHDYQFAEVRRQAKRMGGINGFGVGLGKTATALLVAQHVQNIGVKKKTIFVVPNSVLSNWRKEAIVGSGTPGEDNFRPPVYANGDDCLFVGLDVGSDGSLKVSSANYPRDMAKILENRHRKIFMTLEAFTTIPMRPETMAAYKAYVASVDPSFAEASNKKAEEIRKKGKQEKLADTGTKSSALPFFEDMGVDSLIIDEAHTAKNSKYLLDFQGAKYLSTAEPSSRGLDMQVKAWFVRSSSPRKDGVYALTATPITNSPLEIYGMLSLAVGEEEINSRLMLKGGADAFMNAFSDVTQMEEPDIIGRMRAGRVFLGLQNVDLLRMALGQVANIKSAEDVGKSITVPEEDAMKTAVELGPRITGRLAKYQRIYRAARSLINEDGEATEDEIDEMMGFAKETGESVELLAHPFNLINKMSNLIMDDDLDNQWSRYTVSQAQKDIAEKAVAAFNAKKFTEKVNRPSKNTDPKNVVEKVKKDADGTLRTEYVVTVVAKFDGEAIIIDTTDYATQSKFLAIAEKLKLDLDCSVSPKIAAFLSNFRKERAMPKAAGKIAKQIVFCDMLGMHNKLKMLLSKQCGVPASKIGIINAKAVSDPADMQDIQDGFNADDVENAYEVIIANKKAEVGINLQKGTQAIHHLTLGWTPDSLTQRNGRGVRQGNYLSKVTVYHYDANGTFDEYKRQLVGKKDDWIGNVMNASGGNSVQISGGLSDKEMHDLIMSSGNEAAMEKIRAQIALRERQRQSAAARESQVQALRIIQGQQEWLKTYSDATAWRNAKIDEYVELKDRSEELGAKIERTKSEAVKDRLTRVKEDVDARMNALGALLEGASLDYSGKPASGMGFWEDRNGRGKKTKVRHTGSVNPESPLYAKYLAERGNIERALESARTEYKTIASKPGAYTESTLSVFESGDGAVIGGVLLTKGMVGRHKSQLWIAKSPQELVHPPTKKAMPAGAAISGFEFFGPADADEDWLPIAHECAAIDEATIAEFSQDGFVLGDARLYSSFSDEIAAMVKAVPTGKYGLPSAIALAPPYFPFAISASEVSIGGELTKHIFDEQANALEWIKHDGVPMVRVKDLRLQAERDYRANKQSALMRYAVAHQMKASHADFRAINADSSIQYFAKEFVPEFNQTFDSELSKIVAESKTEDDFDMALNRHIRAMFHMLSLLPGTGLDPISMLNPQQVKSVTKAKLSVASGNKPMLFLNEIAASSAITYQLASKLYDKLLARIDTLDEETLKSEDKWKTLIADDVLDAKSPKIGNFYFVQKDFAEFALTQYQGEKPDGAVVVAEKVPEGIESNFKYPFLQKLRKDFATMKAAQFAEGIDVPGLLAQIEAIFGVESVKLMTTTVYRPAKYGNGNYLYKENLSVAVKTRRGSTAANKVSDREKGLTGRHWDKDYGWMLTLQPGEKDSYGKPVASVQDFIDFLK